jgi:hypothetical protein
MFYFSLIILTMVYSIEQNRFIFCFLLMVHGYMYLLCDFKNEFRAKYQVNIQNDSLLTHIGRIVNRFLTTGIVSKGKS